MGAHQLPEPHDFGVPRVEHRLDDVHRGVDGGLEVADDAIPQETASQRAPEPFGGNGQQIGRVFVRACFPGPGTSTRGIPPPPGLPSLTRLADSALSGTANNGVIAHGCGCAGVPRRRFGRVGSGSIGVTFPVQDLSAQR